MVFRAPDLDITYVKGLVAAGLDGIASARQKRVPTPPTHTAFWTHTAMGAAAGVLSARLFGGRKSTGKMALGGLLGSIVGCGAALAWASRGLVAPAARGAALRVNAVRDARWLAANPINYA